jgi:peptide/nickel transport system permease protein
LTRLGDIQLAFPVLVLAIAVLAVLGNLILVLWLTSGVTFARIVRRQTLSPTAGIRRRSPALGARGTAILARHLPEHAVVAGGGDGQPTQGARAMRPAPS